MSEVRVCIVGAGRMGRALATRIGTGHDVVVVSRRPGRLLLADGRELVVGDDPAAARGCAVVLLAVPADEVPAALHWVAPCLDSGALAVNLATELDTAELDTAALDEVGAQLAGCKIVGQSGELERGAPAALVISRADAAQRELLTGVMREVGYVVDAPERLVAQVNELVARRIVTAQSAMAEELDALALPAAVRNAALGNLALGVWRAIASGNTGPFLRRIVAQA